METLLNDTKDIDPSFWQVYYKDPNNQLLEMQLEEHSDTLEYNNKQNITKLFDLLIFLHKNLYINYKNNCDNFLPILNLLSIYSILFREIHVLIYQIFRKTPFLGEFLDEFISISTIVFSVSSEKALSNSKFKINIDTSIDIIQKLYLRIINNI